MKLIGELKVPELHDELTRRGLSKKGKKQELIEVCITRLLFLITIYQTTLKKNLRDKQEKISMTLTLTSF